MIINSNYANSQEKFVNIWYLNEYTRQVTLSQVVHHVAHPNCLSTIKFNNLYLLAIAASGNSYYALHSGLIDIQRWVTIIINLMGGKQVLI